VLWIRITLMRIRMRIRLRPITLMRIRILHVLTTSKITVIRGGGGGDRGLRLKKGGGKTCLIPHELIFMRMLKQSKHDALA
jgi:hypothetical protein